MKFWSSLPAWIGACFLITSSGCSHYRLGSPAELPFHTIFVSAVENESLAPQTQALLTENLIEAFLRDGTLKVVSRSEAEAILKVTLIDYARKLSATQESDTLLGRSFAMQLRAEASLLNNRTPIPYFSNLEFSFSEYAFIDDGLPQAEYNSMPLLARGLAKRIKDYVVSAW